MAQDAHAPAEAAPGAASAEATKVVIGQRSGLPLIAHSKSEYRRLTAQGADVLPPSAESAGGGRPLREFVAAMAAEYGPEAGEAASDAVKAFLLTTSLPSVPSSEAVASDALDYSKLKLGEPCYRCGKIIAAPLSHMCQKPKPSAAPAAPVASDLLVNTLRNMAATNWASTYEHGDTLTAAADRIVKQDERILQLEASRSALSATPVWIEVEKAKADAYEDAARLVERRVEGMSSNPDNGYVEGDTNAFVWTNKEAEWASIELDDMVTAIRKRKAEKCHVTQAVK